MRFLLCWTANENENDREQDAASVSSAAAARGVGASKDDGDSASEAGTERSFEEGQLLAELYSLLRR